MLVPLWDYVNAAASGARALHYWREGSREVDFFVSRGKSLLAIEVQSSRRREALPGIKAFLKRYPAARPLLVGGDGIPLERFLETAVEKWLAN